MHPFNEGFRRLAWVASGAFLLLWCYHVYSTFVDDYDWNDAGRWVQVSIIGVAFVALPHIALAAAVWVKSGFTGVTHNPSRTAESNSSLPSDDQLSRRNLAVINVLADQISAAIVRATPNPETNHGQMHDVMKRMMHSTSSQYAFALVQLCRLRKRSDFFNSPENKITKLLLSEQIAQESAAFAGEVGVESDKNFILGEVKKEVDAVSLAASRLARLMINQQLAHVENPLHAWFKESFGIDSIGGQSLDAFTKRMLLQAHQELEARGG